MILSRRKLLTGLIAAPIVVTTPGLLMPVKALAFPTPREWWEGAYYPDQIKELIARRVAEAHAFMVKSLGAELWTTGTGDCSFSELLQ